MFLFLVHAVHGNYWGIKLFWSIRLIDLLLLIDKWHNTLRWQHTENYVIEYIGRLLRVHLNVHIKFSLRSLRINIIYLFWMLSNRYMAILLLSSVLSFCFFILCCCCCCVNNSFRRLYDKHKMKFDKDFKSSSFVLVFKLSWSYRFANAWNCMCASICSHQIWNLFFILVRSIEKFSYRTRLLNFD